MVDDNLSTLLKTYKLHTNPVVRTAGLIFARATNEIHEHTSPLDSIHKNGYKWAMVSRWVLLEARTQTTSLTMFNMVLNISVTTTTNNNAITYRAFARLGILWWY